jgi:hypothetical protein
VSYQSDLLPRDDAAVLLNADFRIPLASAYALLDAAVASETGMAPYPYTERTDVWVTHMTTQDGRFIVETDTARNRRPGLVT